MNWRTELEPRLRALYCTKMGVAWCVATAYAKFPKETGEYLANNKLQDWTYNKAIQKMCESYRVGDADKAYWKARKRKRQTERTVMSCF